MITKPASMKLKNENKKQQSRSLSNIWSQQFRYAWNCTKVDLLQYPFSTLLTIMVIAISLTLPTACYLLWKNTNIASEQWYPTPQLTVYMNIELSDEQAAQSISLLENEEGVESVLFLTKEDALTEFRRWSGFDDAINMLPDNPLPAVAVVSPATDAKSQEQLKLLRDRIQNVNGVSDARLDDGWFSRLTALTGLIASVAGLLALVMIISVFLVIGNSIRLSIFSRRQTINVMKLIGATDGFIMRPFLNGGAVLGATGALAAVCLSQLMIWLLGASVSSVALVFNTTFDIQGLNWEEILLLILISTMIGWLAAWLATMQHLRNFSVN